jgi:hypothetical protein
MIEHQRAHQLVAALSYTQDVIDNVSIINRLYERLAPSIV